MREKLLITGASGFVGCHLIEEAIAAGYEVYAAVRPSSNVKHLEPLGIQFTVLDLNNIDRLKETLEASKINHIVHAAGMTKGKTQQDYNLVNATFTTNLALAARGADIDLKSFLFISSLAAMGPSKNESAITELDVAAPVTFYGKSKLLAEQQLAEIDNLPLLGLRPTAVYGPRERDLFLLLQSIQRGVELYIGRSAQQLSFVYVQDLAAITIRALSAKPFTGAYYNISDGNSYDRYAFAEIAKELMHKKTLQVHVPLPLVKGITGLLESLYKNSKKVSIVNKDKLQELTASNWTCSIEKAQRDLGYSPKFNLSKGLKDTIEWYQQNKWL